ncbi:MAG: bifunctional folylpolyglutamate synthase/dihydrofolate synthase, partial [Treponema sp.]|nr:bifunctional folylpolyglutamate synthase/dihydrofolate synthase [Treponema sp.]
EEIMNVLSSLKKEELPLERNITWFEAVTAYAFVCFKNAGCSHAVIETGLGGRLDSTNIIKSSVCILTRIEKEHTEFLGDTIEKIAFEKAGIIKKDTPVIVLSQDKKAENVFRLKAEEENAPIFFSNDEGKTDSVSYVKEGTSVFMNARIDSKNFLKPLNVKLRMSGYFQAENALLASLAVKKLEPDFPEEKIEQGLSKAFLPGRFELCKNPYDKNLPLILDGAHTFNSVSFTMETLREIFPENKVSILFGCASDKDVEKITECFTEEFESVTLTKPGFVKSCNINSMKEAFLKENIPFECEEDFTKAIPSAIKKAAEQKALLLVTGSFYLVCEVKKILGTLLEMPQVIS